MVAAARKRREKAEIQPRRIAAHVNELVRGQAGPRTAGPRRLGRPGPGRSPSPDHPGTEKKKHGVAPRSPVQHSGPAVGHPGGRRGQSGTGKSPTGLQAQHRHRPGEAAGIGRTNCR